MTSELDSTSASVRKVEKGELIEVLEGPTEDAHGQKRARGRALRDGAAGWITTKGGDGAPFTKAREKPFLNVVSVAALRSEFDAASAAVRDVHTDEVFELLEGPRPQKVQSESCLHCTAGADSTAGWVTLRDGAGASFASPSTKIYICRSTIAMTDSFDISNTKVLRKVDVGEALEVLGGQEQTDESMSISRLQFRAARDSKEGWVTLQGNQGTVYVERSDAHYVADQELPFRAGAAPDAEVLRRVPAGEVLAGLEPAREVRPAPRTGARARALEDGAIGWLVWTPPKAPIRPWRPRYTCKAAVDLTASLAAPPGTGALRRAEVGEVFQVADGPALDPVSGLRRVRLATAQDGAVGWATIRGDGQVYLENA